jgi:predicted RNA-binding protein Jag
MAEEARPETVRIITSSSRPGDILTKVKRKVLQSLKKYIALTIQQEDKDNANVILNTVDYNQKIISLLEGPSYRWLTMDPTELTTKNHTTA